MERRNLRADQSIRCGGTEAEEEDDTKDYPGLAPHTGDPDDRLHPVGRAPQVWIPLEKPRYEGSPRQEMVGAAGIEPATSAV